jgi:hypothetical protein
MGRLILKDITREKTRITRTFFAEIKFLRSFKRRTCLDRVKNDDTEKNYMRLLQKSVSFHKRIGYQGRILEKNRLNAFCITFHEDKEICVQIVNVEKRME